MTVSFMLNLPSWLFSCLKRRPSPPARLSNFLPVPHSGSRLSIVAWSAAAKPLCHPERAGATAKAEPAPSLPEGRDQREAISFSFLPKCLGSCRSLRAFTWAETSPLGMTNLARAKNRQPRLREGGEGVRHTKRRFNPILSLDLEKKPLAGFFPGGTRRSLLAFTSALLMFAAIFIPRPSAAARNLLNNADFTRGSGDSVDGWRTDAWVLTPGTTDYHWLPPHDGEPGEVEVFARRDNDARWVQSLNLGPGWYHISVDARTRAVLPFFTGASISVLEDGIMSTDLRGDNGWKRIGFYLRIGPHGADVDVALRVGGYMNLTRGQAVFRHPNVVRIARLPPVASPIFDLEAIRKGEANGPIGHPWTLAATFAVLGLSTFIGWRMMVAPPAQPSRAERRRKRA
jgi:hypothetical protein